ncbi:hypothetical protein V5O48_019116, partial [Marasmius crinis-equi]
MRDYQIMREFDPTTVDFARQCDYGIIMFEPVRFQPSLTSDRFEELDVVGSAGVEPEYGTVQELVESVYMSLPVLFGDVL